MNVLTGGESIMEEYVFGEIGNTEIVFNVGDLTILNKTVLNLNDIKCVYIKQPTEFQNGTVYFSLDGEDADVIKNNSQAFVYTKSQQQDMDKLLNRLGLEVFESSVDLLQETELAINSSIDVTEKQSFWGKVSEQAKESRMVKKEEKRYQKERIKQMDREGVAYCPKCKSTSLSANKKGFGIGKAVLGASITGGIGLVAGNIGAKKIRVTCLKCGYQFWAGKK